MGAFRDPYAVPGEMINWRAVIVNARPAIGNTSGVLLFLALSAVQPLNAGVLVVEAAWSVLSLGIVVRAWQRRRVAGNVGHA